MKKVLFILMALPLFLVACDDDDDFPNVNIGIETSGCKIVDNVLYVVQGDTLSIDSITVQPVNSKDKVAIAAVNYYWDRMYLGLTKIPPFQISFATDKAMVGRHLLQMRCSLLAVDYSPAIALLSYRVVIVNDESEIPKGEIKTSLFIKPDIDD